MKSLKDIKDLLAGQKAIIAERYGVAEIGIFGSFVRNEQTEQSDLDILVTLRAPISLLALVGLENYLSDVLGMRVDVVPCEDVRPELKREITEQTVYV